MIIQEFTRRRRVSVTDTINESLTNCPTLLLLLPPPPLNSIFLLIPLEREEGEKKWENCASAVTFKLRRLPPRMCHPVYSAGRDETALTNVMHTQAGGGGYYATRPCRSRCSLPNKKLNKKIKRQDGEEKTKSQKN